VTIQRLSPARIRRLPWMPGAAASLYACGPGADARAPLDALLVETARVPLAEAPDDPISDIASVLARPDGGHIVADRQASRVRSFDANGQHAGVVGGPGELREPTAALELADGTRFTLIPPDGDSAVLRRDRPGRQRDAVLDLVRCPGPS
jgi:hypothetical protein